MRIAALVAVIACTSPTKRAEQPASHAPLSSFDRAVALERGHGVKRDFAAAGKLYDELCKGGSGDLRACDKLLEVSTRTEVAVDPQTTSRMCARHDKLACMTRLPGGDADLQALHDRGIDLDQLPAQCAAGDVSACRFELAAAALASVVSSGQEATPGIVDAAVVSLAVDPDVIFDMTAVACDDLLMGICDPKGKREEHDWLACLDDFDAATKRFLGSADSEARKTKTARACVHALDTACTAGSVEACESDRKRRVSSCERCTGGDKRACGFSDVGADCAAAR